MALSTFQIQKIDLPLGVKWSRKRNALFILDVAFLMKRENIFLQHSKKWKMSYWKQTSLKYLSIIEQLETIRDKSSIQIQQEHSDFPIIFHLWPTFLKYQPLKLRSSQQKLSVHTVRTISCSESESSFLCFVKEIAFSDILLQWSFRAVCHQTFHFIFSQQPFNTFNDSLVTGICICFKIILTEAAQTRWTVLPVPQPQIHFVTHPALNILWLQMSGTCVVQERLCEYACFCQNIINNSKLLFYCWNRTKLYLLSSACAFVSKSTLIIFSLHFFPLESTSTLLVFWRIIYS